MKRLILMTMATVGLLGLAVGALAATDTKNLAVSATVSSGATLTLGSATMTFPDRNPDSFPSIAATENPVSVTAKAKTGNASTVTLTVLAGGDLTSGSDTIGISNITWTASGTGYVDGTMNKTTPQSAGSWTGSGNRSGAFTYSLANSWNYPTGNYGATITYTLTAP